MIHDQSTCAKDQLCSWSVDEKLCVDRKEKSTKPAQCRNPKKVADGGWQAVRDESTCDYYVEDPAVYVGIDSESQSMFYHWWASWSTIHNFWRERLGASRQVHFILREINDPMFFQYFGLLSDNCWRRSQSRAQHVPQGACFCNTHDYVASQGRVNPTAASAQMLKFLGIADLQPPKDKVRVGLISRRRKRFILNEYELVEAVQKLGYECLLLPLETMTIYEQMAALRTLDVMIGIHGSALDNSVFLHQGSVMVQLLPYKVEHRCTFQSSAEQAGVHYMEWQLHDQSKAYFHWDLLEQANAEKLKHSSKESILRAGQIAADSRETLMFWINQVR
jgi:hypothetical protein